MERGVLRAFARALPKSSTWALRGRSGVLHSRRTAFHQSTKSFRYDNNVRGVRFYSSTLETNPWQNKTTSEAVSQVLTLLNRTDSLEKLSDAEKTSLQIFCQELLARAEAGDKEAQLFLASTMTEDPSTANEAYIWYKRVAEEHGDSFALFAQGALILTGTAELLNPGSNKPANDATYYIDTDNLDSFLGTDIGVSPNGPDPNSAPTFDFRKWLRQERRRIASEKKKQLAAAAGLSAPQEFQVCSSHVDPVPVDRVEGEKLMNKAAEQGCVQAMLTLGGLYLGQNDSKALEINEEKGLALLARAATEYNSATAFYMVGEYLFAKEKADGVPPNTPEDQTSLRFFKQAAALGDADALYVLGVAHHEGVPGLVQEAPEIAAEYFSRAAEKQNLSAIYHLALMHLTGDGIPTDPKRGIALLQRAADMNHSDALFLLGEIYFSGSDGEDIDYPRALKLFKRAGKLGHAGALHNLGVMYYNGFGTKVDYEKAFYAYQNASVFGHIGAVENLADMYEKGLGVPQSDQNAQYYRLRAKELRDKEASGGEVAATADETESAKMLLNMLNDASLAAEKPKPKPE